MKFYLLCFITLTTTFAARAQDTYICKEVEGVQIRLTVSETKDVTLRTPGSCVDSPYGDSPNCLPDTYYSFQQKDAHMKVIINGRSQMVDLSLIRHENEYQFSGFTSLFQLSIDGDDSGYRVRAYRLLPDSKSLTTYCSRM